jgi:predicted PurR-regulated permease PerM
MIDILLFTLNAIIIYLLADWIIRALEKRKGQVLKNRQIVFFAVFLALALISFNLLPMLLTSLQVS